MPQSIIAHDLHTSHNKINEITCYDHGLKVYNPTIVDIDEGINNIETYLDNVENKIDTLTIRNTTNNDKVKLTSGDGVALYADTLPTPQSDINDRTGWLWAKVVADATKLNYYMYGNTGSSFQFTLADFVGAFGVLSVDYYQDITSIPFIEVYSKPTGAGDAGSFYHSKRKYTIPISAKFIVGEEINLYAGALPVIDNDNRYVALSTYTHEGDNLDTEEILYITLHTDSSAGIGTRILVSNLGYNLNNEITRNMKLVI